MKLDLVFQFIADVAFYAIKAKELECYETPQWTVEAMLDIELLTPHVWDVCCGPGVLAKAAKHRHYKVTATDVFNWGYGKQHDFLNDDYRDVWTFRPDRSTAIFNPPFSLATEFIAQAHKIGFRKIVCFQRFAFWESVDRAPFWDKYPPARIYVCGNRATCTKFGLSPEERREMSTPTAHAWFVYEQGQNTHMPALGRLYDERNPNVVEMRASTKQISMFGEAA